MSHYGLTRDVWEELRSQPARAALSGFAVATGSAVLAIVMALSAGLRIQARQTVAQLGIHVFGIAQDAGGDRVPLARRHVAALAANLPGCRVTGMRVFDGEASGLPGNARLVAVDDAVFRVRPWRILEGRGFDAADLGAGERAAIASVGLARRLDLRPGDVISARQTPLRVIGIADLGSLSPAAAVEAAGGEQILLVPWTAWPTWLRDNNRPDARVDAVFIKAAHADAMETAIAQAQRLLRQPGFDAPRASWITPAGMVRQLTRLQRAIALAGGTVAALCLLLGGTTLMSLLLAGVQQRIPEIGLRMALGASRAGVGALFTAEAVALTAAAAFAGAGAACLFLAVAGPRLPLPLAFTPLAVAVPVLSGVILGAIFSFWPARLAAGIAPADALRNG